MAATDRATGNSRRNAARGKRAGVRLATVALAGYDKPRAEVVELADTQDLGSCAERRKGSTPFLGNPEQFPQDGSPANE